MPLTARQSFIAGFLLRCAHEGLSQEETTARIKQAAVSDWIPGPKTVAGWGFGIPAAVGIMAGVPAGLTLAGMKNQEIDPQEVKNEEMIAALKFYAENARRSQRRLALRAAKPAPSSPSLRF